MMVILIATRSHYMVIKLNFLEAMALLLDLISIIIALS